MGSRGMWTWGEIGKTVAEESYFLGGFPHTPYPSSLPLQRERPARALLPALLQRPRREREGGDPLALGL